MFHAIVIIVVIRAGPKLHFLDRDRDLLFLGFVGFLFLFVLELAEINYAADGRLRSWRHLDQVETTLSGRPNRLLYSQHTQLFALFANYSHLGHANPFVNAHDREPTVSRSRTATSKACSYCCTS